MTAGPRRRLAGALVDRGYHLYVATVAAAAVAILAVAPESWSLHGRPATFAVLAAFTLAGELLPIKVPRRGSFEFVTTSIAYAYALLLLFGLGPAAATYAVACVLADLPRRKELSRVIFNAGQCVLVVAAGAAALALANTPLPVSSVGAELLPVLAAAAAFFVADNVLTGAAVALLSDSGFLSALVADPGFYSWTTGSLLALGPVIALVAPASNWVAALPFLPILAIYIGGSYAVRNNHRALHDELTGLPNRRLLLDELENEVSASGAARRVSVAVVDVAEFKAVNEALGHESGDALLCGIAERLRSELEPEVVVARVGSDEFAVVTAATGASDCGELCERILLMFERPFDVGGIALEVRGVVGTAVYGLDTESADSLLEQALVALRHAKREVARWRCYSPELDASSIDRLLLAGQLRRAIDRGELEVLYQPKLALRSGVLDGVEALLRWNHPDLGTIQPSGFIPLAERTGLITPLTRFVLRAAARQCADWRADGFDIRMAVNLSPRCLLDASLADEVARSLRECALPGNLLQVEVTESRIVNDMGHAQAVLSEIRALGVSVAIDDFGTGYSSLAQLQALNFDELKIDKSFVLGMERDEGPAAIVRSTIDLARHLGISVTAEGVETKSMLDTLDALGCDFVQGFCVGPPLPPDACLERLRSTRAAPRHDTQRFGVSAEPVQLVSAAPGARK